MKLQVVQQAICHVLGVLSLWASTSYAQQQTQPRLALKLTPEAQQKQQADPNFITSLFQRNEPQGLVAGPRVTVSASPLIGAQNSASISKRLARAAKRDPSFKAPNFDAWYQVQLPSGSGEQARTVGTTETRNSTGTTEPKLALPQDVVELIHELHKLPEVESVHALHPGPPPAVDASDDPRSSNQGYLDPAPLGIDARYGWSFPGGDGAGVNIVDVEQGWNLNHEDLVAAGITLISGHNAYYFFHGTGVLGEMLMVDNQLGGVGIVPRAKGRVISQHRDDWSYNTPDAILDAVAHMSFGDILLLEAQEYDPVSGVYYWPVEIADATFEAIQVATSLGITVVQAGCNGANDLDAYINLNGKHIFDRSSPDYRESGAIMVGGASSTVPHFRWYGSNYGSRIDVYGWAEAVETADTDGTGSENSWYTSWFSGTSSASPIIVGAASIVQGISSATRGFKMGPLEIRNVLAINGTPSNDPAYDRIGVMPNLKLIIDTIFNNSTNNTNTPNIYIRDQVGDTGDTTSGGVSSSPDIIVRQQPITNPATALGPGSGTENNPSLSEPVLSGQDHSLYIRLLNRGKSAASSTSISVYWSEPATLVTPNMWHQIGTVTLPSIPAGNTLTVSPRLNWPASGVPASGHYCFVALAGTDHDPVPVVPTTFPDFVKFVRENNNVAWRNFNVIPSPPNTTTNPDGFHRFGVTVPGAFDEDREFVLKAVGKLPQGSKVRLEVPKEFAKAMGIRGCTHTYKETGEKKVQVELKAGEMVQVGKGALAAGTLAKCELQVKVPKEVYEAGGEAEFALVQEWEGVEVGRVTWRFGPVAEL